MPVYKDEKEEAKEGSKEGAKSAEEAAAAAKDAAAAAKAAAEKASQAAQQAANAKYIEQLRLEAGMTDDEDIPFDWYIYEAPPEGKAGGAFFAGSGGFIPESQATQAEMYVYIRK